MPDISFITKLVGRSTPWRIAGSAGSGLSVTSPVLRFGAGAGTLFLYVKHGSTGPEQRLIINGVKATVGAGLSSPVNLEGSIRSLPGGGIGQIYSGPAFQGDLKLSNLQGLTFIYTPSVATGGHSVGMSMVLFDVPYCALGMLYVPGMQQYLPAAFYRVSAVGFCASAGWELTAAGASMSVMAGTAAAG